MRLSKSIAVCLVASAAGAEVSVTKCTTGAADILGTLKVHTAQVCNLFGSTCYLNHPSTEAANCGTEALEIKTGECKLYPIRNFKDNAVRTGADAVEYMTVVSNYGCSVTPKSDGAFTYSGACVSMQCEMGSADARTYAGLAYSNKDGKARVAVTDTTTHEFLPQTVASISDAADQLKNVFLVRTGNYIATTKNSKSSSGDWHSRSGELPTSDGNNYGPVACPSSGNLITSAKADAITSDNLRMCGATGKWVYYNALNLVLDKSMYAKYSNDVGKDTPININAVPFLFGKSAYKKGDAMDDPRMVMLNDGKAAADAIYMTSNAISPKPGNKEPFSKEIGGAWRSYGVAFYCDDYARTDLTKCAADNRKMLYVGDPAPNVAFGTAMAVSSSAGLMGAKCTDGGDCCSGLCVETFCAPGCETFGAVAGGAAGGAADGAAVGAAGYELVGDAACSDDAGGANSPGTGDLKFKKTTTKSSPHTNCQAACTADSTCTGYDDRASGCLYYKIKILSSNKAAKTYQCYRKTFGTAATADPPAGGTITGATPAAPADPPAGGTITGDADGTDDSVSPSVRAAMGSMSVLVAFMMA